VVEDSPVAIGQIPAFHLEEAGEFQVQTAGHVLFAAEPSVRQDVGGAETSPDGPVEHLSEELVLVLFLSPAQIPRGGASLICERLVRGLEDGRLLAHDDLRLDGQESLLAAIPKVST